MIVPVHYLITELSMGGAQTALFELLSNINRERFQPTVSCLYNGDHDIAQKIRDEKIPVQDLGMTSKLRVDAFVRMYKLIRKQRPTILHTWMFHANIPGRLLGRIAGVPIIISSERVMEMESPWRLRVNRETARYVDRICCVSENVAKYVKNVIKIKESKISVIQNGIAIDHFSRASNIVDIRDELDLAEEAPIVAVLGRLHRVKGHKYLIEAWAKLQSSHKSIQLLIIGSGEERQNLEDQSASLGIQSSVKFIGYRPDASYLLPSIDIAVLPSISEGMPNAALEAMLAGKPMVATRVGGTPEVVLDGRTGILVPPKDPDALARAIDQLLSNPYMAEEMGAAGRQRVKDHFDLKQTVLQTEELYENLLKEKLSLIYHEGHGWESYP